MHKSPKFGNPWSEPSMRASGARLGGFWSYTKITVSGRKCTATRSSRRKMCGWEEEESGSQAHGLLEINSSGFLNQVAAGSHMLPPVTQPPGSSELCGGQVFRGSSISVSCQDRQSGKQVLDKRRAPSHMCDSILFLQTVLLRFNRLTYNKLYTFKVYNLIRFDMDTHFWNLHHNHDNK